MRITDRFFDKGINPTDDFYKYANGDFIRFFGSKPDITSNYFYEVSSLQTKIQVRELIRKIAASENGRGSIEEKISILYRQMTDSETINKTMISDLKPLMERIYAAGDKSEFAFVLGELHRTCSERPFFKPSWADNFKDAGARIFSLRANPFLLLGEESNIDEDGQMRTTAAESLQKALDMLEYPRIGSKAGENAIRIDSLLSGTVMSKEEEWAALSQSNHFGPEEVKARFPGMDFDSYFKGLGLFFPSKISIDDILYIENVSHLFETEELDALKDYTAATLLYCLRGSLPETMVEELDKFFKYIYKEDHSKLDRDITATQFIGEHFFVTIGKRYVAEHFDDESRGKVTQMAVRIKDAARKRFRSLDWLSSQAKEAIIAKLDSMAVLVGYPDIWPDTGMPDVSEEKNLLENLRSVIEWGFGYSTSQLNTRKTSDYWVTVPQKHNACYAQATNSICLTAAYLQKPYVDLTQDLPSLYGSLGVTIGHEIMHAFDDYGIRNNYIGSDSVWDAMTPEDRQEFDRRREELVRMINGIEILPGLFAKGNFSVGEVLADQGGLLLALDALHLLGDDSCKDTEEGTADQLFFLAFAHFHAAYESEEVIRRRVAKDTHLRNEQRVSFTISTLDEFHQAFGTKEGDRMWRPESERVVIWK